MREVVIGLLLWAALGVECQYPQLNHNSNNYLNNSFIEDAIIGQQSQGGSPLQCLTNHTPCCTNNVGGWTDPEGNSVHEEVSSASDFYVSRGAGVINLNRISEGLSGMWRCDIPDSNGAMQSLYIYIGADDTGTLESAMVSFSSLLTDVNVNPPQFILTCLSEGGPVTSILWQRNSTMIEEDEDHVTSQILVDTGEETQYENRLTVAAREAGQYQCTVRNNRNDFHGETGSVITSDPLDVTVAGEPARPNAIQLSPTSILVTWDPPSPPATGYKVFIEPGEHCVDVDGGETDRQLVESLQSGLQYSVSIVALSTHLPSTVVGPVTPVQLDPPSVSISGPSTAYVGQSYTLTCVVIIPEDIVVADAPRVEFTAPNGYMATPPATGSGPYSSIYLVSLTLTSGGVYTCSATYNVNHMNGEMSSSTSPEGLDTITVNVTIQSPTIAIGIENGVPYLGNDISIGCFVTLLGVSSNGVSVVVNWMVNGSTFTGDPERVNITLEPGFVVTGRVRIQSLQQSDSGRYTCEAVVTPEEGNVPPVTASRALDMTVIIPSVEVTTDPPSLRILDHHDYNNFNITCTASAHAQDTPLDLEEVVWERRVGDSGSFLPVPTSSYTTTNMDSVSKSILGGSETDTSATIHFRCTATISGVEGRSSTSVTVSGPTPPGGVDAIRSGDLREDEATIRWTVLFLTYTPETYVVMYGTDRTNLNRSSPPVSSGDSITARDIPLLVTLTGLEAVTTYHYSLTATNSFGSNTSDVIMNFTTTARTTSPPTNFNLVGGPDLLTYTFSWGVPDNLYNSVLLSYRVTCTPTLAEVSPVGDVTQDNVTTTATLVLANGLMYNCCVVATNRGGPSDENCLSHLITTPEGVPTGPPENFGIEAGSTNLTFSWDPPKPTDRNGIITSYTIQCSDSPSLDSIQVSPHTAYGFTPNTMYTCSIHASTAKGPGPAAEGTVNTLEAPPAAPPTDFTHTVMDGVANVMFQWRPPPEDLRNGVITEYTVTCVSEMKTPSVTEDSLTITSLTITSLSNATWYSCTVSASTSAGEGPPSQPIDVLTVPSAPGSVEVAVTDVGLRVTWDPVTGNVTGYKVLIELVDREDTLNPTTDGTSYTITSMMVGGYERVRIQVTAVNTAGSGPASAPISSRTPSIAPGPVVIVEVSEGDEVVTVSWKRPDFPNGILTSYTVSLELYGNEGAVIESKEVDNVTLSTTINITGLRDGVPYHVVVVAVNEKGLGERNPLLYFTKELTADVVMLTSDPVRSDSGDTISLIWEEPSPVEVKGYISWYEVDFIEAAAGAGSRRRRRQGNCQVDSCMLEAMETGGCCQVDKNQTSVTITGLDPRKAYNISVSVVNGAGRGRIQMVTVEGKTAESDGGFPVGIVAGAVVGVVIVVVMVVGVIAVIFLLRRRNREKYREQVPSPVEEGESERVEMTSFSATNVMKSPEEMERMRPIELDQFADHVKEMHQDRDKGFEIEYQSLSTDPIASNEVAKNNKNKNRFANIFPYDHNRVPLTEIAGEEGSDYINASFINGYSRSKAYIAAQGPMSGTITDFWRMIWEHKPTTIVMLTKQVEGGKRKCEVYWPEKVGGTFNAGGGIMVHFKEQKPLADHEIKIFTVHHARNPEIPSLDVHHFQFLGWPDHGVPKYATSLINFIRRLHQHHQNEKSPMLVHCSAGVGRTGTFILLDSMLERIEEEKTVNVYEFLTQMRRQRVHMVQTLAQYVFIHDALEELITCGDTSITSPNLKTHVKNMKAIIPEKAVTGFTYQFKLLQRVSRRPTESDVSDALQAYNREKNRYPSRVPYDKERVKLKPNGVTGGDYINATFLDGYKQRRAYIATQAPLKNTTNDLWRMMWEVKSRAIVMLCQLTEDGQETCHQYWPTQCDVQQVCGKNTVTMKSETELPGVPEVTVRKFEITDDKNTSTFSITQYQVTSWPEKGCVSPQLIIKLIDHLNKLQRTTENRPITVMCNDGMGRTGVFVTIHAMVERMNTEGVVDFFQFIKSSRISRPDIVREQDHYILCHDTVADYLESFGMYANFNA